LKTKQFIKEVITTAYQPFAEVVVRSDMAGLLRYDIISLDAELPEDDATHTIFLRVKDGGPAFIGLDDAENYLYHLVKKAVRPYAKVIIENGRKGTRQVLKPTDRLPEPGRDLDFYLRVEQK
jgi:hypothetical protein